jgi:hypothetical protein
MSAASAARSAAFLSTAALFAAVAAADELRDPMRPPMPQSHSAAPVEAAPVLSAVMNFSGGRAAIFNGQLVHAGSVVGPYTIETIFEDGVQYRRANQTHELRLAHNSSSFKKPSAEPPRAP